MASTRAKARAFRDMDHIGMTALEELGDLNDIIGGDNENRKPSQKGTDNVRKFAKQVKSVFKSGNGNGQKAEASPEPKVKDNVVPMTEKQAPVPESKNAGEEEKEAKPAETPPAQTKGSVKPNKGNGNGGNGKSKPAATPMPMMSEAQKSALYNLSRRRGISLEDIKTRSMDKYGVPVEQLTSENAGEFIRYLQAAS